MRLALAAFLLLATPAVQALPTPHGPMETWIWSDPRGQGGLEGLLDRAASLGLPVHEYEHLGMAAFVADAATAQRLAATSGGHVERNGFLPLHLDKSVPAIAADRVKDALGLRRDGPTVLVVDTGTDSTHPDFQDGNLVVNAQAVRQGGLVVATVDQAPVVDMAGHGTHVAGIVAGSGASLGSGDPLHGRYEGVYSIGRMASYQASGPGEGEAEQVEVLAALEGFDWALENQDEYDLRVVTNSWGDRGGFDPGSAIHQATLRLYLAGFTVFFSAGNAGEDGPGTLNRYCVAPWVLCVAAADLQQARVGFSSYGANDGKPYDHPDLSAPGLAITSAKPLSGATLQDLTNLLGGSRLADTLYVDSSGTSMATPHAAGVAGLLLAANPALSPDQVMDILVATTKPMADPVSKVGSGFLDARAAYNLAVSTRGNLQAFLAGEDVKYAGPLSRDPMYANDPVTVGYDGLAAPSPLALDALADDLWVATPLPWVFLAVALVAVLTGTRWRSGR